MLDGLGAGQGLAGRKVLRLDAAVMRQLRLVQGQVAFEFRGQINFTQHRIGAQLDGEGIAQVHGRRGLCRPACQLGAACGQHAVVFFARLASVGRHNAFDPASGLHARELAVNLLVRGVPEMAYGFVKTPRQVVARGGFFQKRSEHGVGQGHGRAVYSG